MHRALYVEDIIHDVFFYIQFHSPIIMLPDLQSQIDFLSLARTCRTFKEPALDILWERLEDLSPLVRCLPEASWVYLGGVRQFRCFN